MILYHCSRVVSFDSANLFIIRTIQNIDVCVFPLVIEIGMSVCMRVCSWRASASWGQYASSVPETSYHRERFTTNDPPSRAKTREVSNRCGSAPRTEYGVFGSGEGPRSALHSNGSQTKSSAFAGGSEKRTSFVRVGLAPQQGGADHRSDGHHIR